MACFGAGAGVARTPRMRDVDLSWAAKHVRTQLIAGGLHLLEMLYSPLPAKTGMPIRY